jgi:hypothetical protein
MRYRLLIAAVMTAGVCVVGAPEAQASSHREAPFVTKNPKIDSTDFYAFKSFEPGRDGYITIIANYLPLQDAYGGPNYFSLDPEALYEIHVDNNADGGEDITFQFQFKNTLNAGAGAGQCANCNLPVSLLPAAGGAAVVKTNNVSLLAVGGIGPATTNTGAQHVLETYTVNMVKGDRRTGAVTALGTTFKKPIDNIGTTTLGDFNAYDTYANNHITQFDIPGCTPPVGTKPRVFVGQRAEGFAANIGVIFDLLQTGNTGFSTPSRRATALPARRSPTRSQDAGATAATSSTSAASTARTSRRSRSKCRSRASSRARSPSSASGRARACARRACSTRPPRSTFPRRKAARGCRSRGSACLSSTRSSSASRTRTSSAAPHRRTRRSSPTT